MSAEIANTFANCVSYFDSEHERREKIKGITRKMEQLKKELLLNLQLIHSQNYKSLFDSNKFICLFSYLFNINSGD